MKREFNATELAELFGGVLRGPFDSPVTISGFATDSRHARPGDLFIAINGANMDGRNFLDRTAASIALAEAGHPLVENPPLPVIAVDPIPGRDSIAEALARFGRRLRSEFRGPVVGVTGSVGKSTVKELIFAALSPLGEVAKTEGNRNTEYTGPLVWAEVGTDTKAVVIEMGMRGRGQIAHLASIAQPTIGVVTNVGVSHLSELASLENIARAKSELLSGLAPGGTAIIWADDPWRSLLEEAAFNAQCSVRTFGGPGSDAAVVDYSAADWSSSKSSIAIGGSILTVELPYLGRHLAVGVAAALLVADSAGVDLAAAAKALSQVELPPMRMAVREHLGVTWVLDMYNAAPVSTIAAMETVAEVGDGPKFAILGEMRELGEASEEGHREVGAALARLGFDGAITLDAPDSTSEPTRWIIEGAMDAGMSASKLRHAASFEEVREWLSHRAAGETILVKGSRGVELEKVLPDAVRT